MSKQKEIKVKMSQDYVNKICEPFSEALEKNSKLEDLMKNSTDESFEIVQEVQDLIDKKERFELELNADLDNVILSFGDFCKNLSCLNKKGLIPDWKLKRVFNMIENMVKKAQFMVEAFPLIFKPLIENEREVGEKIDLISENFEDFKKYYLSAILNIKKENKYE